MDAYRADGWAGYFLIAAVFMFGNYVIKFLFISIMLGNFKNAGEDIDDEAPTIGDSPHDTIGTGNPSCCRGLIGRSFRLTFVCISVCVSPDSYEATTAATVKRDQSTSHSSVFQFLAHKFSRYAAGDSSPGPSARVAPAPAGVTATRDTSVPVSPEYTTSVCFRVLYYHCILWWLLLLLLQ
jgi:hypothetical protein